MCDSSSMKKRGWPPLERISTFEYMNLEGSEAAPGFPGLVMAMCDLRVWVVLYVCVWVSQSLIYFSFSRATTCRVNLLVWKEMERTVCMDAAFHSLTSSCFPFIYGLIICCSRRPGSSFGNAVLYVKLQLLLLMFQQHSDSIWSAEICTPLSSQWHILYIIGNNNVSWETSTAWKQ